MKLLMKLSTAFFYFSFGMLCATMLYTKATTPEWLRVLQWFALVWCSLVTLRDFTKKESDASAI